MPYRHTHEFKPKAEPPCRDCRYALDPQVYDHDEEWGPCMWTDKPPYCNGPFPGPAPTTWWQRLKVWLFGRKDYDFGEWP